MRQIALGVTFVMGAVATACANGTPQVSEPARATPPPTAYVGTLATSSATPTFVDLVAASEMSRMASPGMVERLPVAASSSATVTSAASVPPRAAPLAAPKVAPLVATPRGRVVERAATSERRVALTFDAGADRGYAEQILDTLRNSGVHASFGMTGQWAEANPDLLRRMVAEGHHLINHTQTHDSFTGFSTGRAPKSSEARARELALTEQAVQRIAGATTKPYFRPPYGDLDASVVEDVHAQGYDIVAMWTVDSQGWNGLSRASIEARCLRMAAPGAVYVFHVGSSAQDGPALPVIIEGLRKQGYQMGTLDWLLHQ